MAVRPRFDAARDFVAARAFTFNGHELNAGDPFPKDETDPHKLKTVYGARLINFKPEDEKAPDPVEVSQSGSWYTINAPWLEEPISCQGKARANREAAKLRREGEPAHHHGVELTEGENGWWAVTADWAEEAENVHGEEAARARAAELRAEGPPPDPRTDVTVTEDGDEFIVNAPWLEEAQPAATREEADSTAKALRESGPPEGWEPVPAAG